MTTAIIKPRISSDGHPCTDVFIDHAGQRYYSRVNYPIMDSPHARAAQIQSFLNRKRRFNPAVSLAPGIR